LSEEEEEKISGGVDLIVFISFNFTELLIIVFVIFIPCQVL
jgi:hypothetical protein